MPTKSKSPLTVPQLQTNWYCAVRLLKGWLGEDDTEEDVFRPYLILVLDLGSEMVLNFQLSEEKPTVKQVFAELTETMLKEQEGALHVPHRPVEIHFDDKVLVEKIRPLLEKNLIVSRYQPQAELISMLVETLEKEMFPDHDFLEGLIKRGSITVKQMEEMAFAAEAYFKAEPWKVFENIDVIGVKFEGQEQFSYVCVMGSESMEFGFALFEKWDQLVEFYTQPNLLKIGKNYIQFFSFNTIPDVPFKDLDAYEKYGWPVPNGEYYPVPYEVRGDQIVRPDKKTLAFEVAILKLLPEFVSKYLPSGEKKNKSIEETMPVTVFGKNQKLVLQFPVERLDDLKSEISISELADAVLEDPLLHEALMQEFPELMRGGPFIKDEAWHEAMDIVVEAWAVEDPKKRAAIAKKALKISQNCSEAYLVLAEDTVEESEALKLYDQSIQAAQRALGETFLNDLRFIGNYWLILETRPLMRAMMEKALLLEEMNEYLSAWRIYNELLFLNPSDDQGVRFMLLLMLMKIKRIEDADRVLWTYIDDGSLDFLYTKALVDYALLEEDDEEALEEILYPLERAFGINRYVPDYLLGKKKIPFKMAPIIDLTGEDAAAAYASRYKNIWADIPGALGWLEDFVSDQSTF
jgi:tetratricopeptide (TPR) repeat protein